MAVNYPEKNKTWWDLYFLSKMIEVASPVWPWCVLHSLDVVQIIQKAAFKNLVATKLSNMPQEIRVPGNANSNN